MQTERSFGATLKALRTAAGLTQDRLAERAGISCEAISALERGFRKKPHAETVSLIAAALRLDDERRAALERAPGYGAADGAAEAISVPFYGNRIIGRESDTASVLRLVQPGALVTVVGPGGVGKSRFVTELARKLPKELASDGVTFVDLTPLDRADPLEPRIAATLGIALGRGRDSIQTIGAALNLRRTVLVLDNCELVSESVSTVVAQLQRELPALAVIATSRQPLKLSNESLYQLQPLAVPPAVILFYERATQAGRPLATSAGEFRAVADICRRLDGMPLALELAAARLRTLSLGDLFDRLDERFTILTAQTRDVPAKHRALRATIDWSYDLLSAAEQTFWRAGGVFPDGFTLDAATAVCTNGSRDELKTLELLTTLVDKSLLAPDFTASETRYRMLESMRAFALEHLDEAGERPAMMEALLRYVIDSISVGRRQAVEGSYTRLVGFLRAEHATINAALRWALTASRIERGAELLAKIGVSWSSIGRTAEGIGWIEAYDSALADDAAPLHGQLSSALTHLYSNAGRDEQANAAAERALGFARRSEDELTLIRALRARAMSLGRLQRHAEADHLLREAEAIAGNDLPPEMKRWLLNGRGMLAAMRGDYPAASEAFRSSIRLSRSLRDTYEEVHATLFLAEAAHKAGDTRRAIFDVEEALARGRAVLGRDTTSALLTNLAGYYLALDETAKGSSAALEAVHIAAQEPFLDMIFANATLQIALVLALGGNLRHSALLHGYSIATQNRVGFEQSNTEALSHERVLEILGKSIDVDELHDLGRRGARLSAAQVLELAPSTDEGRQD